MVVNWINCFIGLGIDLPLKSYHQNGDLQYRDPDESGDHGTRVTDESQENRLMSQDH